MARTDMFFKATGKSTGGIVGESSDKAFLNQIDVLDWSWGMTAPTAVGGQRTARVLMNEVKIIKRVDKASTALMSVMSNNELLSTAVLSVRKSGGVAAALPYFVVTLTDARITALDLQSDISQDGAPVISEHLSLTFKKIDIEYKPQTATGAAGGGTTFSGTATPE